MPQAAKLSFLHRPVSKRNGCLFILLALVLGFCTIPESPAKKPYKLGVAAYNAGNCQAAIDQFKQTIAIAQSKNDIGDWLDDARAKQAECQMFQAASAKQAAGEVAKALVGYAQFAALYGSRPLMTTVRQQATALFNQVEMTTLAKPGVCDQMTVLQNNHLIPQPETNLPRFYHACGETYATRKDYPKAMAMYEQVLDQYPTHPLAKTAKSGLARAIVADARTRKTGSIPAPEASGSAGSGTTVVVIQNASPAKLRLVFSGPTPRLEELPACKDCVKYANTGPATCPENGTVSKYTLKPGEYEVLVKSIDTAARPFTGTWALDTGTRYNSCFFIVQRS